jgi:acyl-coenzyme A thioesterase PaaI-like protein
LTAVGDAANTGPSDESVGPSGPPGGEGPDWAIRFDAAAALRRLGHAIVAHEVGDDVLGRITAQVEGLLAAVEASPERERAPLDMVRSIFLVPPADGAHRPKFPDSIVTGKANPMGMAADIGRDGDEAVLRTTLGPAFEGAPGRAHGGTVAALLDEVMGFVLSIHATAAYTGRLTVTYRAPAPLGVEIEMRARLRSREGRKLCIEAEARHGTTLVALGEGLFVTVDPERFGSG